MKEKLFSTGIMFYSADDRTRYTITMKIHCIEPVVEECLKQAVIKASERYPYMMVRVKKNFNGLWLEDNKLPFVVKQGHISPPIGSEEANYHLIVFTWEDDCIMIHTFHGLLDGVGLNKIFKTLMFYYAQIRYGVELDPAGINTADEKITEEEYKEPYPRRKPSRKLEPMAKTPRFVKALKVCTKSTDGSSDQYIYRIKVPKGSLNGVMRGLDVSPAPFLGIVMADAILTIHPDSGRDISVGVPINLRPALNADKYCRNLISILHIVYDGKIRNMPVHNRCTAVRGRIFLQSDRDSVLKELDFQRKVYSLISHVPFYGLKRFISKRAVAFNMNDETFETSYTGKAQFGEMEKYYNGLEVLVDMCGMNMLVEMFLLGDTYTITIMQRCRDDRYFDAFIKQLKGYGVQIGEVSCEKLTVPELGF